MGTCPDAVKKLIDHFHSQSDQVRSLEYNETQLRIDFVNPLFAALGWDMDNRQHFAEQYREVVHEDRVKVGGATKAPDYSFRIGGVRKFFLEAKKPAVNIADKWEPAYQLRRYAWSAKLAVSLLTDFEELAIYDCRFRPTQMEKASTARRRLLRYTDYCKEWEFLSGTFSKSAILTGEFDRYAASQKGRGAVEFDEAFLEEIESWRKKLAENLALRNEGLGGRDLNFSVQRIIDRLIFLRICEDRAIEPTGHLQQLLNGQAVYARLLKIFRDADARYNSGLFHFAREAGRLEAPDELTPGLELDDAALKSILKRLYYPDSPYEFSVVPADLLGSVYERFLGKVIEKRGSHSIQVVDKPEVRKAGGVYYTPTYIVDYIVQQTVGKLLEGKTPAEAALLKILDPACGSGSFLLGAYQFLLDWHLQWYLADGPARHSSGREAPLRPADKPENSTGAGQHWALTTRQRKAILLNNLYGVDLDYQAVEVTKLSLLLKCLEGETAESINTQLKIFHERALPDLGQNIQCGNSLIGTDIYSSAAWEQMSEEERQRVNPFDFERGFGQIFKGKDGGFDAVIGNPPYIRMETFKSIKTYLKEHFQSHAERSDLYAYFMERGHRLLNSTGRFGMIVSNKFIRAEYGVPLRSTLLELAQPATIADFAGLPVFQEATVRTIVYLSQKGANGSSPPARYAPPPPALRFEDIRAGRMSVHEDVAQRGYELSPAALGPAHWQLASAEITHLMRKLAAGHPPLVEVVKGQICRGVVSGLTEAFVIDEARRRELLKKNSEAKEIIKPLLNGRDVRRYHIEEPGQYLIYTYHGINMQRYPAVLAHLKPFKQKLESRATRQEWYELQQPQMRFAPLLDGPKLIFPDIATEPRFALDTGGHYGTNTTYFIPRQDLYLLALLNSRLAFFFFRQICAGLEGGDEIYLRFFGQYLEGFPIPSADQKQQRSMSESAMQMLSLRADEAKAKNPQTKEQLSRQIEALDRKIDQQVYRLYGLEPGEIELIERTVGPSGG